MVAPLKERKVSGQKPSYVKCRGWGHMWDVGQTSKIRPIDGFHEVCRCIRCTTERVFWVGWDGKAIARWYDYPDDFKDVTEMSRAEAKLWLHKHLRGIGQYEVVA